MSKAESSLFGPGPVLALTLLACAGCGGASTETPASPSSGDERVHASEAEEGDLLLVDDPEEYRYRPVSCNRSLTIPEGFRGEVHPALAEGSTLEVHARWDPKLKEKFQAAMTTGLVDTSEVPEYTIPPTLVKLVTEIDPARESVAYTAADFSTLLPEEIGEPGQMWSIDPDRAARFAAQFHPATSTTFDLYAQPYGRRPGPPGAFGVVRAVSDTHVDIAFRLHVEYVLREGVAIYTPACFLGKMLVNRRDRSVESFEAWVPTERAVNVNLTLFFPHPHNPEDMMSNIVFEKVEVMDLRGGDLELADRLAWDEQITETEAFDELRSAFYKFMDIEWVPMEEALAVAKERNKPLMAVVLTSPLDDQSC